MEDQTMTKPADFNFPKHYRFTECNNGIQNVVQRKKRGELPSSPSFVITALVRRICEVL